MCTHQFLVSHQKTRNSICSIKITKYLCKIKILRNICTNQKVVKTWSPRNLTILAWPWIFNHDFSSIDFLSTMMANCWKLNRKKLRSTILKWHIWGYWQKYHSKILMDMTKGLINYNWYTNIGYAQDKSSFNSYWFHYPDQVIQYYYQFVDDFYQFRFIFYYFHLEVNSVLLVTPLIHILNCTLLVN